MYLKIYKNLSEVTFEDAIKILSAYEHYKTGIFHGKAKWTLEDRTEDLNESCQRLSSRTRTYVFWFFDDEINIDEEKDNQPVSFDDCYYDVNYQCYIEAVKLGYYVPQLTEIIEEVTKKSSEN